MSIIYLKFSLFSLFTLSYSILKRELKFIATDQTLSVSPVQSQSCLTLSNPIDCSMPGFPIHQHLLELAQTHVHSVSDAIQSAHPLLSPSPPAFSLSQHQSFPVSQFFASGGQSTGVSPLASVLPMNI